MIYFPILKSLSTLAVIILAGWCGRRLKIFSAADTKVIAALVYNFSLPALFFVEMARIDFTAVGVTPLLVSVLPIVVVIALLMIGQGTGLISKDQFILLGLSVVFGSNAFFGVPFFESLYGQWGLDMAVYTGAMLSVLGIVSSITLFEYALGKHQGIFFLLRILKSPLTLSIVFGAAFQLFKPYGVFVQDMVMPLARGASGIAIFMLGMFMHDHFSPAMVKKALPLALFRIVLLPLLTLALGMMIQNTAPQMRRFLLIQSGIPAAISIAIFAERYQYKVGELTGMVIVTSLASFATLGLLYVLSAVLF
ncbi:MAG: AEC family transporter [Candidatus Omnitrophica bacterium]|nr:AEC family transporter [Candidatus Omnitrophota bacterium]